MRCLLSGTTSSISSFSSSSTWTRFSSSESALTLCFLCFLAFFCFLFFLCFFLAAAAATAAALAAASSLDCSLAESGSVPELACVFPEDFLCFRPLLLLFFFLLRRLTSKSSELEVSLDSEASELELLLLSYFFFDLPIARVRFPSWPSPMGTDTRFAEGNCALGMDFHCRISLFFCSLFADPSSLLENS